jgi:hypothetical protein
VSVDLPATLNLILLSCAVLGWVVEVTTWEQKQGAEQQEQLKGDNVCTL